MSKVSPDGTTLVYSTFVRAANHYMSNPGTECIAIALHIDDSDPTNVNAFVIGLNATATAHVYGSCYGGSNQDIGFDLAAHSDGLALTGRTYSTNLTMVNPYQGSNGGDSDAFIARFRPYATPSVSFSTYLGGKGQDQGTAIDTHGTGRGLYCVGLTYSWGQGGSYQPYFPTTPDALVSDPLAPGCAGQDIFFCRFQSNGLVYSTYLGGDATDEAYGLAKDPSGYYIAGMSAGQDFYANLHTELPGLPGYQTTNRGGYQFTTATWNPEWPVGLGTSDEPFDAFVLKLLSP
ncbi:MAG: hypothetical protein HY812_11160 [Planctomycetes bacterium]|nr:hypothetical protein [Planctomycetota bacterium]